VGRSVLVSLSFACAVGCSSEEPVCAPVARDCAPLYEPTYDALFRRTLNPSCGVAGSTCHQSPGAGTALGLAFDSPDGAYAALLDDSRSWRRVVPNNPECSKIVHKITSHDAHVVMPPGRPLSGPEQCVIIRWIANGAAR
jgi:hypothetical protein